MLRFGIMCRGTRFPQWQAQCLQAVLDTGLAEPALLIVEGSAVKRGRLKRRLRQHHHLLFNVYNTLVVKPRARSYRQVDLGACLAAVPRLVCETRVRGPVHRFEAEDVAGIRAAGLDFILRFGFDVLRGEILDCARYGIWSYHHGDEQRFRGPPPGFWEIFGDEPATGVLLQRLTEQVDNGSVLFKGRFRTALTYRRNVDRIYLGSSDWAALALRRIAGGDAGFVFAPAPRSAAPMLRAPDNLTFLRYLARQTARLARIAVRRSCFAGVWNVGYLRCAPRRVIEGLTTAGAVWAAAAPGARYLADPIVVQEGRETRIYAEEFSHLGHGRLVSLGWPDGFAWDRAAVECDVGRHLSYPFVFRHAGDLWMVPESCSLGQVLLLRKDRDGRWQQVGALIEGAVLADPTPVLHRDRWWLFAADGREPAHTKLLIFEASRLTGPWRPHRLNPVKVDVTGARPAGPLFEVDGRLYRPAQDCAAGYGGAIAIHEVLELSSTGFAERAVARIEPAADSAYPHGVHTATVGADGLFVDGKRDVFRPYLLPLRARRWLREQRQARLDLGPRGLDRHAAVSGRIG